MYTFNVIMSNDSVIEVQADYAEDAEKRAEFDTGLVALFAEEITSASH